MKVISSFRRKRRRIKRSSKGVRENNRLMGQQNQEDQRERGMPENCQCLGIIYSWVPVEECWGEQHSLQMSLCGMFVGNHLRILSR